MSEMTRVPKELGPEPTLSQAQACDLLESMIGAWTGWFDEYGGVDAYREIERPDAADQFGMSSR
jgi:hypothetical protein